MMKHRFVIFSLGGAVLLMALVAFPSTQEAAENTVRAEKPVLIPQTKFVFEIEGRSGTYSNEYLKKEGGFLIFRRVQRSGRIETYRTTEDLASVDNIREDGTVRKAFRPHSGFLSFPLYVGKEWRMRYVLSRKKRDIRRERSCRVWEYTDVEVKAGVFPSFIIRCENQRDDRIYPAYERYAYAPDVGQVIHYTSVEFKFTYQLVKIVPPTQQTISK